MQNDARLFRSAAILFSNRVPAAVFDRRKMQEGLKGGGGEKSRSPFIQGWARKEKEHGAACYCREKLRAWDKRETFVETSRGGNLSRREIYRSHTYLLRHVLRDARAYHEYITGGSR